MTVFDNVAYPLRVRRRPAAEILDRVTKALQLVEMEGFAERPAPALSGGQQQRVAIARALVCKPAVVLADEPTGSLDSQRGGEVLGLLAEVCRERQVCVVLVTHDPQAAAYADRVHTLRDGRLVEPDREFAPINGE
jgi:iron(III) transport system ATP-binding protein